MVKEKFLSWKVIVYWINFEAITIKYVFKIDRGLIVNAAILFYALPPGCCSLIGAT